MTGQLGFARQLLHQEVKEHRENCLAPGKSHLPTCNAGAVHDWVKASSSSSLILRAPLIPFIPLQAAVYNWVKATGTHLNGSDESATFMPPSYSTHFPHLPSPSQAAVYNWVKATGTIRLYPSDMRRFKHDGREFAALNNKVMEMRKVRGVGGLGGRLLRKVLCILLYVSRDLTYSSLA